MVRLRMLVNGDPWIEPLIGHSVYRPSLVAADEGRGQLWADLETLTSRSINKYMLVSMTDDLINSSIVDDDLRFSENVYLKASRH